MHTGTHDYIRHGTITLFAALSYLDGKIFRQTAGRHTHEEWLDFIKHLEKQTPVGLPLPHRRQLSYPQAPESEELDQMVQPASSQATRGGSHGLVLYAHLIIMMNLVERFLRDLTVDCVRDGSFTSTGELVSSIETYLAQRDLEPKRYVWKAGGQEILRKLQRARDALATASASKAL